ncbi:MAG: hypothetical protein PWQ95_310 [Thermococcaceae archaeon]|nr:hypothetical protein [Thermococcaceae archaeon]
MKRVLIGVLLLVLMSGAAMVVYFRGGDDVVKASGDEYSERIKLELNGVTYSPRDTITLRIVNNYNESITTGYHFQLYRMENGDWKEARELPDSEEGAHKLTRSGNASKHRGMGRV